MSDLVSVVIPVFEQDAYVVEAVESLLNQRWTHLEIICVDDGSSDRSRDVLGLIGDERLRIIAQPNSGPSVALNTGIAAARGDFVIVMGGDDVSQADRISRQIEQMQTTGTDFLFCRPQLIDQAGAFLPDIACLPLFDGPARMSSAARYRRLFDKGNHLCAPTMCARRSALAKVGPFHPGLVQLQDWDYWARALAAGCRIDVSEERLVRYRRHGESLSHSNRDHIVAREALFVWNRFFDGVSSSLLREAFAGILDPASDGTPLRSGEEALCYLAHGDEAVRQLGFLRMIEARDPSTSSNMTTWLDYPSFRSILSHH